MVARRAKATLPEELIEEIVVRLPVKSVGRCRCVSTRWRSLFSDPHFIKSHLHSSPMQQVLILQYGQHPPVFDTLHFDLNDTTSFENHLPLENLRPPSPRNNSLHGFLGSCNGLVASFVTRPDVKERLFIWNPCTGFVMELPSPAHGHDKRMVELVLGAEMFSSRNQSWKRIVRQSSGVFCSGALHWLPHAHDQHQQQVLNLYAFDLEREEFSMLKLPDAVQQLILISVSYELGVPREGCLFVMVRSRMREHSIHKAVVDFWVMREYGNCDSWALIIGCTVHQSISGGFVFMA